MIRSWHAACISYKEPMKQERETQAQALTHAYPRWASITQFRYFLTRFPYSTFPSLLPRFSVPSAPHFACFTEHLTSTNPPMSFSHILIDGIAGIVSDRAPVINRIPYTSFATFLLHFGVINVMVLEMRVGT